MTLTDGDEQTKREPAVTITVRDLRAWVAIVAAAGFVIGAIFGLIVVLALHAS